MTWQLATAKIYNGSQWVNAAGGADVYAATDGTDIPTYSSVVSVTASATPHTKGAWVEAIASTGYTANRLLIAIGANSNTNVNSSALFDVGIGAAGAEVVKIENLAVGYNRAGWIIDFPIYIPSGSRIAFRMQSAIISKSMNAQAAVCRTAKTLTINPSSTANTYGANTANSQGTSVTSGNNTKGAWTQITANSGSAAKYLFLGVQGNGSNSLPTNAMLLDIGIGAAGAETVIVPNVKLSPNTVEVIDYSSIFRGFFVSIPASSRLSVRTQATSAVVGLDVVLHTINEVGSL